MRKLPMLWPVMLGGVIVGGSLIGLNRLLKYKGGKLQTIACIVMGAMLTIAACYALCGIGYAQFQYGLLLQRTN